MKIDATREDPGPKQTVLTNTTERRKSPRTSIRRLAYVNLNPYDNGGVITDISKEGLRFHLVNPVQQGGVVRLSILLGAVNEFQVIGELMWLDAARKVGGVRFTVLPDGAADQILNWAEASNSLDASGAWRDGKVHSPPHRGATSTQANAGTTNENSGSPLTETPSAVPQAVPRPVTSPHTAAESKSRSNWVPPSLRSAAGADSAEAREASSQSPQSVSQSWRKPDPPILPPAMPWIAHFDPDPPPRGTSFVRGLLGGFVLCTLLGFAAWVALQRYGWPDGQSLPQSPTVSHSLPSNPAASDPELPALSSAPPSRAGSNTTQLGASPEGTPFSTPNASVPDALSRFRQGPNQDVAGTAADATAPATLRQAGGTPPVAPAAQGAPSQSPIAEPAPASTSSATPGSFASPIQVPRSPDAGETQLMLARQYLDGHVHPRNPTVASQLLWAAVEKGNSAAEMDLADLYLHGDGVARNCDQARVLLSVASGKGNTEAMQKLRELNRTGCR